MSKKLPKGTRLAIRRVLRNTCTRTEAKRILSRTQTLYNSFIREAPAPRRTLVCSYCLDLMLIWDIKGFEGANHDNFSEKISIICTVTLLMGFGFFMMARKGIWGPCIILAVVWLAHVLYFTLRVKTIPDK